MGGASVGPQTRNGEAPMRSPVRERAMSSDQAVQKLAVSEERSTVQCVEMPFTVRVTAALLVPSNAMEVFTVTVGSAPTVVVASAVMTPALGKRFGPVDSRGITMPAMLV